MEGKHFISTTHTYIPTHTYNIYIYIYIYVYIKIYNIIHAQIQYIYLHGLYLFLKINCILRLKRLELNLQKKKCNFQKYLYNL